jgi:hypothetical protein
VLVSLLAALGVAQLVLGKFVVAQNQSGAQAPRFEVDPFGRSRCRISGCSGNTIGLFVARRTTSGSSIAAPPTSMITSRPGAEALRVLHGGATRARLRSQRNRRPALGRVNATSQAEPEPLVFFTRKNS